MDSGSKFKIKSVWLEFVLGMVIILALTFICFKINGYISQKQIIEMVTFHPEMEQEINNTFEYYELKRNKLIFSIGVIGIVLYVGIFVSIIFLKNREVIKFQQMYKDNFKILLNQIEQFKKGNYDVQKNLFVQNSDIQSYDVWYQIEELLRELGYVLIALKDRLEVEENSTKALITDISHQLKTPLASLKMSYELSQEESLTEDEKIEFVRTEKHEIFKLESLLDELVKLSRLESHMIQIEPEKIDIRKILTEAMNQVFIKAHKKSIEIQADIPENIQVFADSKWTVEAFINVMDNAIKYSSDNTSIKLRVIRLANLVLVEVEDDGMGIPVEELHKVFHRFFRGKQASQSVKEGAGVGLYLTRKILEEQGGTITAKRKQVGTIFRITLPL